MRCCLFSCTCDSFDCRSDTRQAVSLEPCSSGAGGGFDAGIDDWVIVKEGMGVVERNDRKEDSVLYSQPARYYVRIVVFLSLRPFGRTG